MEKPVIEICLDDGKPTIFVDGLKVDGRYKGYGIDHKVNDEFLAVLAFIAIKSIIYKEATVPEEIAQHLGFSRELDVEQYIWRLFSDFNNRPCGEARCARSSNDLPALIIVYRKNGPYELGAEKGKRFDESVSNYIIANFKQTRLGHVLLSDDDPILTITSPDQLLYNSDDFFCSGDLGKTDTIIRRALRLAKTDLMKGRLWAQRANIFMELGDIDECEIAVDKSLKFLKRNKEPELKSCLLYTSAQIAAHNGNLIESKELIEKAQRCLPKGSIMRITYSIFYAHILSLNNKTTEADREFNKILSTLNIGRNQNGYEESDRFDLIFHIVPHLIKSNKLESAENLFNDPFFLPKHFHITAQIVKEILATLLHNATGKTELSRIALTNAEQMRNVYNLDGIYWDVINPIRHVLPKIEMQPIDIKNFIIPNIYKCPCNYCYVISKNKRR